jgi:uncharacterized membrane protein YoaK (UPF0700 family)
MTRLEARARMFAVALSAVAGFVDAVGYMQSGGFFVSFMSGNSTRLGVGIIERASHAALALTLIACFILGVAGGSLVARDRAARKPVVLGLVATVLALAAVCGSLGAGVAALLLAAFAMGAENATFEEGGEVRVGLTYMTGTLVKIGQRLAAAVAGKEGGAWFPYLQLWLGLVGGAALGTYAQERLQADALWIAAMLTAVLALVAQREAKPVALPD